MDPVDEADDILRQNRSREKQFMFDLVFDGQSTQVDPPTPLCTRPHHHHTSYAYR